MNELTNSQAFLLCCIVWAIIVLALQGYFMFRRNVTKPPSHDDPILLSADPTPPHDDPILLNEDPIITLIGGNNIEWPIGTPWKDPGYFAIDPEDGKVGSDSAGWQITAPPDTTVPSSTTITYTFTDSDGGVAEAKRIVNAKRVIVKFEGWTVNPSGIIEDLDKEFMFGYPAVTPAVFSSGQYGAVMFYTGKPRDRSCISVNGVPIIVNQTTQARKIIIGSLNNNVSSFTRVEPYIQYSLPKVNEEINITNMSEDTKNGYFIEEVTNIVCLPSPDMTGSEIVAVIVKQSPNTGIPTGNIVLIYQDENNNSVELDLDQTIRDGGVVPDILYVVDSANITT